MAFARLPELFAGSQGSVPAGAKALCPPDPRLCARRLLNRRPARLNLGAQSASGPGSENLKALARGSARGSSPSKESRRTVGYHSHAASNSVSSTDATSPGAAGLSV